MVSKEAEISASGSGEPGKWSSLGAEYSESPPQGDGGANKKLLSTSSPEGIQVASKITPTRLANLLIKKGPLPIRHITSHLSSEVPGFEHLSLSKQRRLIMGAMEQTDPENGVVFEKIGWGQWAVRKVGSEYIVTEGTEGIDEGSKKQINVNELRKQSGLKLGWTKKQSLKSQLSRRQSISNKAANLHNIRLPNEGMHDGTSMSIELDSESDYAISDMNDDSSDENSGEEDEELFLFDHDEDNKSKIESKRSPPIKFANRVPLKVSPPPNTSGRHRNSASNNSSITKNTHSHPHNHRTILNRSRLNSIENLDNYILSSSRNSNVSVNSPPISLSNISGLPLASWVSSHDHLLPLSTDNMENARSMVAGRRKSSFNESNIRSTLSTSVPKNQHSEGFNGHVVYAPTQPYNNMSDIVQEAVSKTSNVSDTDEEDWATIGAKTLRDTKASSNTLKINLAGPHNNNKNNDQSDERDAAIALVDLMSV